MNETEYKASLYKAIDEWFGGLADTEELPDAWWHDDICERMTEAALAVFMGASEASQTTKEFERE